MDQSRKLPIYSSLIETARKASTRAVHMDGRSMPATVVSVSGSIATVNFELESDFTIPQIAVPIFGAEYIRQPIQKGCKGVVIASDYYLGAMSGLGPGRATLPKRGNLSNLVFFPIGNSGWEGVDPDTLTMYGVSGVKILDKLDGSSYVEVEEGAITLESAGSIDNDAPVVTASENFSVGNGATGSFSTGTGLTVTVQNGIITNIY